MKNDEPHAIDRVLEEALAEYSSAEPLAGIEQRVLRRVRAEGARTRGTLWRWVFVAGAVVAASITFMAVVRMRPVPDPVRVIAQVPKPMPRMASAQPSRKRSTRPGLPRRRDFPIPAPVSQEERALLALVTRSPDETREAFRDLQQRSTEPIRLEEIKIEPLQSDGSR
jgi:hypothetical protein